MSNIENNLALSLPKTQARMLIRSKDVTHLVLARISLLLSSSKRPAHMLLVFLNKCKRIRKRMELLCTLHPEVFRISYFPQGMEVLSSS
jgi:hypothetical protein